MQLPSLWATVSALLLQGCPAHGQLVDRSSNASPNDTLGLTHGFSQLTTRQFAAELVRDAQLLVSLRLADGSSRFDFLPRDRLNSRARNGQHHWGDVNLRYRLVPTTGASSSSPPWIDISSSSNRKSVTSLAQKSTATMSSINMTVLASADLGDTLSSTPSTTSSNTLPFTIVREWLDVDGDLGLRFRITYKTTTTPSSGSAPVLEIGGLGFPATVNNIFTNRSPEDVQAMCSLADPYIGMDAGYLRIAPVSGKSNASVLLVTPLRGTRTPFEAYRNLDEPSGPDDTTNAYETQSFEGFYEWQTVTSAWADNEWRARRTVRGVVNSTNGEPWNGRGRGPVTLSRPGDSVEFGLRFTLTSTQDGQNVGPAAVDATLRRPDLDMPVVRGVPGYVLPRDLPGQLFVWPPNDAVGNITVGVYPPTALSLTLVASDHDASVTPSLPLEYKVTASSSAWGRVRVELTYHRQNTSQDVLQTVHYYVTKQAASAVGDLGHFLTTKHLFSDTTDPFGRAPSILTYDVEMGDVVRQEPRVWIAGLSDEAGAGSFLAAAAKQAVLPDADELAVLALFVDRVLWGVVQQGPKNQTDPYAVRKSVFFHDPAVLPHYAYNRSMDWSSWTSWTRTQAYAADRAYDYVHVAATYWVMYRAARAYPDVFVGMNVTTAANQNQNPPWQWYLRQASETVQRAMATTSSGVPRAEHAYDGLMGETVFSELLTDLKREAAEAGAWASSAASTIEAVMRARARRWAAATVPFDSEMAWDSTAQEGVHLWSSWFGDTRTAQKAVDTVLGFTPAVPHWAWNGNARRYWDNKYGGKLARIERQVHHYGSALNGLVLLREATLSSSSDQSYHVRVGYAGTGTAALTNIATDGFASASFHSWPDTLEWDAYSGDYGPGFLGMALGGGTYVVQDTDSLSTGRLLCYGGILSMKPMTTTVYPRDAWQRRVFLGSLSIIITIDAGIIDYCLD
ncbi:hypothetical protein SEUCBS139899_006311 [Sporothrix eucalyptigena]|uniref:Six-hairpin glycosidase-like protein n=1 Tax=Sporothrix eucalyptigena TaxID=1812306 RepID=A0ABP0CQU4_9PEZI